MKAHEFVSENRKQKKQLNIHIWIFILRAIYSGNRAYCCVHERPHAVKMRQLLSMAILANYFKLNRKTADSNVLSLQTYLYCLHCSIELMGSYNDCWNESRLYEAYVIKPLNETYRKHCRIFYCPIFSAKDLCFLLAINARPFSSSRVTDGSAQVWNARQLPHCVRVHGTAGLTRAFPVHGTERSPASSVGSHVSKFHFLLFLCTTCVFLVSGFLNRWILREYLFSSRVWVKFFRQNGKGRNSRSRRKRIFKRHFSDWKTRFYLIEFLGRLKVVYNGLKAKTRFYLVNETLLGSP